MSLTRAQVETIIVRRRGKMLARVGLDGATMNGTNADLADPIAASIRLLGLSVVDPTSPADADLAPVMPGDYDQLFDVAEYFALGNCLGNWAKVTQQAGTDRQDLSDLLTELRAQLKDLRQDLKEQYGFGTLGVSAGLIDLGFASQDDVASLNQLFN